MDYPLTPDDSLHFMRDFLRKMGFEKELEEATGLVYTLIQRHYELVRLLPIRHHPQSTKLYYDALADVIEYVAKGLAADKKAREQKQAQMEV